MSSHNERERHDDQATTQTPFWTTDEPQREPMTALDRFLVVTLLGFSLGVIGGAVRWIWATYGEQISAFFWAAITLAY